MGRKNLLFLSRGTRGGTSSKMVLCFILPISYIAARVEKSISIIISILPTVNRRSDQLLIAIKEKLLTKNYAKPAIYVCNLHRFVR